MTTFDDRFRAQVEARRAQEGADNRQGRRALGNRTSAAKQARKLIEEFERRRQIRRAATELVAVALGEMALQAEGARIVSVALEHPDGRMEVKAVDWQMDRLIEWSTRLVEAKLVIVSDGFEKDDEVRKYLVNYLEGGEKP